MTMKKEWQQATMSPDHLLYRAGSKRIIVGQVYKAVGNKAEPNAPLWVSKVMLPGIKQAGERFENADQAKLDVETRCKVWFGWMND